MAEEHPEGAIPMVLAGVKARSQLVIGGFNIPMPRHFADTLRGHAIIQHHIRQEMSGVMGVEPSDTSCDVTNITEICQLLQICIVPEITVHRNQFIEGYAARMILALFNQFFYNRQYG